MSKVYSFRLDENNPREAQAREVIDAWVEKGYSLRHIIIEALIIYHNQDSQNSELEEILERITHLLGIMTEGRESIKVLRETLPETFVGAISKSVKSGIRIVDIG